MARKSIEKVTILSAEALHEQGSYAGTLETFGRLMVRGTLLSAADTIKLQKLRSKSVELDYKITVSPHVDPHTPGGCYLVKVRGPYRPDRNPGDPLPPIVAWFVECRGTKSL